MKQKRMTHAGVEESLKTVDAKIDKIFDKLSDMDKTLARNTDSLEYHVRRTNLLEDRLETMVEKELKPVKDHVVLVQNIGWATLKLVGILVAIGSLIKIFI